MFRCKNGHETDGLALKGRPFLLILGVIEGGKCKEFCHDEFPFSSDGKYRH